MEFGFVVVVCLIGQQLSCHSARRCRGHGDFVKWGMARGDLAMNRIVSAENSRHAAGHGPKRRDGSGASRMSRGVCRLNPTKYGCWPTLPSANVVQTQQNRDVGQLGHVGHANLQHAVMTSEVTNRPFAGPNRASRSAPTMRSRGRQTLQNTDLDQCCSNLITEEKWLKR